MDTVRGSLKHFLLFEGILFILLGVIAIAFPNISTLGFELFLGWLFVFSGLVQAYRSFELRHQQVGLLGSWLSALLSLAVGIMLLMYPLSGIISLTLLLIIFFILDGIAKIIWGVQFRSSYSSWGWLIFSGLISLALAFIIWSGWPGTATWVLGLLIGINLLFFGGSLIGLALAIPKNKQDINGRNDRL